MGTLEPEILSRLFDHHAGPLMLYAGQWCAVPEDVVQEAFLSLVRVSPPPENPVGWLYRAVRNGAINASRSDHRRRRRESAAGTAAESWFARGPDDRLDAQEAARTLAQLPLVEREVIVARLWGGLGFAEIAQLTGSSTSQVHRIYHQGLAALRERFGVACPPKKNCPKN
jgi:RNA polymerase sigma factor (sigma-70 family)